MFYAITGTMLVLLVIGVVFTAVYRLPRSSAAATSDRRSSPPTPCTGTSLTAAFCAVWLIVYVTK